MIPAVANVIWNAAPDTDIEKVYRALNAADTALFSGWDVMSAIQIGLAQLESSAQIVPFPADINKSWRLKHE